MLFGPLTVAAISLAQQIPFNAIFLISDPMQKWRLAGNFLLYMLPFLAGALYLGTVFLKANKIFGRVYFADLSGAGLCGLAFLVAMYLSTPENLIVVPLILWFLGSMLWFTALANRRGALWLVAVAVASIAGHFALPPLLDIPKLAVSDYKGVAYARKFPDSQRVYERASPFGYLEVYSSSYLHFAPGLSDNAAFSLPKMPENAYLGMYIDGEGPSGIIRDLPAGTDGLLPLPADGLSLPDQAGARHVRGPVRRRHLDLGRAAQQLQVASPWRREIPPCSTPSAPTRDCAISPATCSTIRKCTSSITTAGSISPTPRSVTTSST